MIRGHAKASPKLAGFVAETMRAVHSGAMGREAARESIRAWPTILSLDLAVKASALRELAVPEPSIVADPEEPPEPPTPEAIAHAEAIRTAIHAGWVWHRGQWFAPGAWKPAEAAKEAREANPLAQPTPELRRAATGDISGQGVYCRDCSHAEPTQHTALIVCGAGLRTPGACGMWRALDRRNCPSFVVADTSTEEATP